MENDKEEIPAQKIRAYIPNPWVVLGIFTLFYIGLSFLTMAGQEFFTTHIIREEHVGWMSYLITAAVLFGILFFVVRLEKITLINFEHMVI